MARSTHVAILASALLGCACSLTAPSASGILAQTRETLARIKVGDPANAVLALDPTALAQARAVATADRHGVLFGEPVLIKDNIHRHGMPTTAGSIALVMNVATADAPIIANLRAAGAVIVGKTNLSEWANFRSSSSSSGWSAVGGLTTNPYDATRTACGSSAGSAAAVAQGLVNVAIGTETDGSITCPASICGIVGLKPTVGLLSQEGIVPISSSQDTAGPMTRNVRFAAQALTAMVGNGGTDYASQLQPGALRGVRLGVLRFHCGMYGDAVATTFANACKALESAGAILIDIETGPDLKRLQQLEWALLLREFKTDLNAYLSTTPKSVRWRSLADVIRFNDDHAETEMPHFDQGIFLLSQKTQGRQDPKYPEIARDARQLAGAQGIDQMLKEHQCQALICPTTGKAWAIRLKGGDTFEGAATSLAAVSGYPHLTVPMGLADGLPIGLSFMGPSRSETLLLSLGSDYENARGPAPRPRRHN